MTQAVLVRMDLMKEILIFKGIDLQKEVKEVLKIELLSYLARKVATSCRSYSSRW